MTVLVFTCPETKTHIPSGIDTDAQSLALVSQLAVSIFCPTCGKIHRFTAKDGHFAVEDRRKDHRGATLAPR